MLSRESKWGDCVGVFKCSSGSHSRILAKNNLKLRCIFLQLSELRDPKLLSAGSLATGNHCNVIANSRDFHLLARGKKNGGGEKKVKKEKPQVVPSYTFAAPCSVLGQMVIHIFSQLKLAPTL